MDLSIPLLRQPHQTLNKSQQTLSRVSAESQQSLSRVSAHRVSVVLAFSAQSQQILSRLSAIFLLKIKTTLFLTCIQTNMEYSRNGGKNWHGMRLLAIQVEGKKCLKSSSCPYLEKEIVFSFEASKKLQWLKSLDISPDHTKQRRAFPSTDFWDNKNQCILKAVCCEYMGPSKTI